MNFVAFKESYVEQYRHWLDPCLTGWWSFSTLLIILFWMEGFLYEPHQAKNCLQVVRIEKAQISLCICTVWSGPSLSTNRIIGYYRMYKWRAKARMIFCMFKDTSLLDAAHILISIHVVKDCLKRSAENVINKKSVESIISKHLRQMVTPKRFCCHFAKGRQFLWTESYR